MHQLPPTWKCLGRFSYPVADPVDDSWDEDEEEDVQIHQEENDIEKASDEEEESVPMFTEYVALRGRSFHEDCQSTLKKCRELLCAIKRAVELREPPEPNNIRDCNALIIQAKVENQWDRIGYIPKEFQNLHQQLGTKEMQIHYTYSKNT